MANIYSIQGLQGKCNDFIRHKVWNIIGPIRNDFSDMLENIEDTVNEQIYARNGDFPIETLDILWMTRLLSNKYGQSHTSEDSKQRIFFGKNRSQQGKQMLDFLNQVANLDYETSPTSTEFDPELMRALNTYISQERPESYLREIETIEDSSWFNNQLKPIHRTTLDKIWSDIGSIDSNGLVRLTKEQELQASIYLGQVAMQRVHKILEEAYCDLFSLWNYQGTWVKSDIEALISADLSFNDVVPEWYDGMHPQVSNTEFEQFVNTFRQFIIRQQEYVQNSGKVFNPKYQGKVWTMPESENMMAVFAEDTDNYKEMKKEGMNPGMQIVEQARKYLFK